METLDTLDMFGLAVGLPEQARRYVAGASEVDIPDTDGITSIVVAGLGGSGIGGAVLAAAFGNRARVPIQVVSGYEMPGHVGDGTLVFAVSYSGETEETLAAVEQAMKRGASVVGVTSGGTLGALLALHGCPVMLLEGGYQPRSQIAALTLPLVVIAGRGGLIADPSADIDDAIARMDWLSARLSVDPAQRANDAAALARRLDRRIPLVYGSVGPAAVAAYRWKCQVNENAKAPAFCAMLPEANHNELCGWGQHGDVTRQVLVLIELRHDLEHPQVAKRFEYTREMTSEAVGDLLQVKAAARTPLGVFFELGMVGDFVSLFLARMAGIDPGPVPILAEMKSRLAAP